MITIHIRQATTADADIIADANCAMAAETEGRALDRATVLAGVQRALDDPSLGVYYVAEQFGKVAGQLLITTEFSDWRDGVFWWIQSVYVWPDHRGQGVYRALHDYVLQQAREAGDVCGVRLYVDQGNTRAQAVYRQLGMMPTAYALYEIDWGRPTP